MLYVIFTGGHCINLTVRPYAVKSIWQEVTRVCVSEKTCFTFINAWRVTLSLLLSDVIFLHTECCEENKFSSSHPSGLLCFGMKGGEIIHGHYHTECVQCRYVALFLVICPHLFVIYFYCVSVQ